MTDDDGATNEPDDLEPLPPALPGGELPAPAAGPDWSPGPPPHVPRSHRGRTLAIAGLVVVALVAVAALAVGHHGSRPTTVDEPAGGSASRGPTLNDHWHAALGVDDCGEWLPNWLTPTSMQGVPVRAGTDTYAGLHSHGDGLIHIEPATPLDEGKNATLGRYVTYAGYKLSERAITFFDADEKNGDTCDGKAGVLRWAVNGKEQHGDPADYKIGNGDVIALVFTTPDAALPPQSAVPSYRALEQIIGVAV
jgi:hypothetical protein